MMSPIVDVIKMDILLCYLSFAAQKTFCDGLMLCPAPLFLTTSEF